MMLSIAPDRRKPATPSTEAGQAGAPNKDSRTAPRLLAADVPSIEGIRLSPYRAEAVLINISTLGILAECGMRLQPGTEVTVLFSGSFTPSSATGRVARTVIARIGSSGIRYHVGIAFTQPILLPAAPAGPDPLASVAAPLALSPAAEAAPPEEELTAAPAASSDTTPAVVATDARTPAPLSNQW